MILYQNTLELRTPGQKALVPVTRQIQDEVRASGVQAGTCTALLLHTSASLLLQEGDAAPDLQRFLDRLVPEGADYLLVGEGPDDMPAHIRATLTCASLTLPVVDSALHLSRLQDLFLWEHRQAPHTRRLHVTVIGVTHR